MLNHQHRKRIVNAPKPQNPYSVFKMKIYFVFFGKFLLHQWYECIVKLVFYMLRYGSKFIQSILKYAQLYFFLFFSLVFCILYYKSLFKTLVCSLLFQLLLFYYLYIILCKYYIMGVVIVLVAEDYKRSFNELLRLLLLL